MLAELASEGPARVALALAPSGAGALVGGTGLQGVRLLEGHTGPELTGVRATVSVRPQSERQPGQRRTVPMAATTTAATMRTATGSVHDTEAPTYEPARWGIGRGWPFSELSSSE